VIDLSYFSSITDFSLLTPYPNEYNYNESGKPREAANRFNEILNMGHNLDAALNKTHTPGVFAILVSHFAMSSIAIICGLSKVSKILMAVGFAVIVDFGAQYPYFKINWLKIYIMI
jgi:hypothetical protein